jgi:hypothetical protein
MNRNIVKITLVLAILLIQVGCVKSSSNNSENIHELQKIDELSIDSFSEFPSEIDGCSCYFSNDSNEFKAGKYIYVNDFADISFLKINGEMVKFKQTKYSKKDSLTTEVQANEGEYELIIRILKGRETGDETQLQTGTLILKSKRGKKIVKSFYGECGC